MDSVEQPGLQWGIYVRISVDKGERGDEDYVSLETQEAGCRELIAASSGSLNGQHVWREIHTGIDLFERPVLSSMREAIRRQEIDAVAVYQPKRLSRDPDHASYLKTEADHYGVKYRFVLDDHGDSDTGALLSYLEHWTGKKEHKDITERTMRARVALVKTGRAWAGPKAPFGLRWTFKTTTRRDGRSVMERDRWDEDPETGPIVRWLFREALKGTSMRSLAANLEQRQIPAPLGGKSWYPTTVRLVLRNPTYVGDVSSLRSTKDEEGAYVSANGRKVHRRRLKDEAEWVRLPDGYAPPLVERDTFEAVQRVLTMNRQRAGRKAKYPDMTLLAGGRAKCGICGSSLTPRRPHEGWPQLFCYRRDKHPDTNRPGIACHILDAAAMKLARMVCEHPEIIREQAELHCNQDPTAADLDMVERTLAQIARKQQSLALVAQSITDAEAAAPLAMQLDVLASQKRAAQAERDELLARRAGWEAAQSFLDDFAATCEQVKSRLDGFTHADWQQAIDALGITMTVWPEGSAERFTLRLALTTEMTRHLPALVAEYPSSVLVAEKSYSTS